MLQNIRYNGNRIKLNSNKQTVEKQFRLACEVTAVVVIWSTSYPLSVHSFPD